MQATRFERITLTSFLVTGWVAFFSAAIAHAQPLYASPPPPPPPPTFNPIDSIYCASIARDPRFAGTAKRRSEIICICLAFNGKSTSRGRWRSPPAGDSYRDIPRY